MCHDVPLTTYMDKDRDLIIYNLKSLSFIHFILFLPIFWGFHEVEYAAGNDACFVTWVQTKDGEDAHSRFVLDSEAMEKKMADAMNCWEEWRNCSYIYPPWN